MMRHVKYAVAVAALLFVGAGCAAGQNPTAEVAPTTGRQAVENKPVIMNARAEGTVAGTVDGILKDADSEQASQKEVEGDATEVDSDKAQLNAYGDSSYDVK